MLHPPQKIKFIYGNQSDVLTEIEHMDLPAREFSLIPQLERGKRVDSGPCNWRLESPPAPGHDVFVQASFVNHRLAEVIPIRINTNSNVGSVALGMAGGA